ncbi:protein of unknown function [Aquiflexum balticum DSM 16537]|uniref:3-keto-alpha-glucoside-1,2-lyase/3-keto-2-hydroxy-glucal hydratase domain-containing protein n=1 Tax=Aquiflexum balticum DSM 16537 TaxID=758820 RepID=A0A1W2H2Z5_9BACT|nr:DUF1080 domain-containing protein [Aquiflexum balticum]SMD43310.1 protein of unknown function [Aquiflexum balticum DSM 16537]
MKIIQLNLIISSIILIASLGCSTNSTKEGNIEIIEVDGHEGFISIFNGQSLDGWEGDTVYWRVENGILTGEITPETILNNNTFLIWEGGELADFELKLEFKISESGNSGINYRSERFQELPYALRGYQADIDGKNSYTGQNYEERKRTTLAYRGQKTEIQPQDPPGELRDHVERNAWKGLLVVENLGDRDSLKNLIQAEDWNSMHLIIKENVLQHFVNGVLMSEVVDNDPINRSSKGLLGVQVHVGPPMKVEFRNIFLKEN